MSQFGVSEADTTDHVKVKVKLSNLHKIGKYNKKIREIINKIGENRNFHIVSILNILGVYSTFLGAIIHYIVRFSKPLTTSK